MKLLGKWSFLFLLPLVILLLSHSSVYGQWTMLPPSEDIVVGMIDAVHFTSADEGWVVSSINFIHYQNGIWKSFPSPPFWEGWLTGVHFTSPDEGWAVGMGNPQNGKGFLFHYQSGSWTIVPPPKVSDGWHLNAVHFTSADEGWAVGFNWADMRAALLHYQNGTWTSDVPPDLIYVWTLNAVHFTTADEGWAVGEKRRDALGALFHYQSGSWTIVPPPEVSDDWHLNAVHFTSANEGWAVGEDWTNHRGVLLRYRKGTWTSVTPPTVSDYWALRSVHFTSADEGWAVGMDNVNSRGVLLHYRKGTWTSVTPPTKFEPWGLSSVHFTSANEGWAIGWSDNSEIFLHYFIPSPTNALSVVKAGQGTGTVTSNPTGISCGIDCSKDYPDGTVVTLTALADTGSEFRGWSGGGCSGTGECVVTVNANTTVTATFALPSELLTTEGTIGTQVTITGSDFGTKKGKVLIGGFATKIAKDDWQSNSITCTVTKAPSVGTHNVTIKPYKTDDIVISNAFTIKPPEIDSLSAYNGVAGVSSIIITGNFFSTKKGKVYFEDISTGKKKNCKVTLWGMDSITFIVPKTSKSFPPDTYPLKVDNKIGTATTIPDFTIEP